MSKITAADVAQRAGVSLSAVSRVFTPGGSASRDTVAKVRKAALDLGYRHPGHRKSTGGSGRIALVVSSVENPFYAYSTKLLSMQLQARGYTALVLVEMDTVGTAEAIISTCLDQRVDGIIASSVATTSELADRCDRAGVPSVFFNRSPDDEISNCVTANNYAGGRKIAEHLVASGREKIAHLAGWRFASTQRDREAGFIAALGEAGRTLYMREEAEFDYDLAREVALRMFSGSDRPDAIFVANDHMAFAVMDAVRHELGLSVPRDVAVVGYDDVPMAAWPSYDLTTVRQPVDVMAAQAIDILIRQIEAQGVQSHRVAIEGSLIVRGSAGRVVREPQMMRTEQG